MRFDPIGVLIGLGLILAQPFIHLARWYNRVSRKKLDINDWWIPIPKEKEVNNGKV